MIQRRETDDLDAHTYRLPYQPNDWIVFQFFDEGQGPRSSALHAGIQIIGHFVRLRPTIPSEAYSELANRNELCIFRLRRRIGTGPILAERGRVGGRGDRS